MQKTEIFKTKVNKLIAQLEKLIAEMPQKGDKPQDCQKMCLLSELGGFERAVNGVEEIDFYHEEEEE